MKIISVNDRLYAFDIDDVAEMRRAAAVEALSESWRGYFRDRLEEISIMDRGYDKIKPARAGRVRRD
jgi:3-alpha domain